MKAYIVVAVFFLWWDAPAIAQEGPFVIHGYQLGMQMEDAAAVRKMRRPTNSPGWRVKEKWEFKGFLKFDVDGHLESYEAVFRRDSKYHELRASLVERIGRLPDDNLFTERRANTVGGQREQTGESWRLDECDTAVGITERSVSAWDIIAFPRIIVWRLSTVDPVATDSLD